jgi:hypothetical protein
MGHPPRSAAKGAASLGLYGQAQVWFRAFRKIFAGLASRLEILHDEFHRIRHGSADFPRSFSRAPDLPSDPLRTLIVGANALGRRQ